MINIQPCNQNIKANIMARINGKTKPLGALGMLENLALQVALIQQTCEPAFNQPHMVVFAGDHGIAHAGVSAYPQEVTAQMVANFLNGGAAINVFCRQHGIELLVVDAGVNADFDPHEKLIQKKVGRGTKNFLNDRAMTFEACRKAMWSGDEIVSEVVAKGCNVIAFGEMGIGNTSSASIITSILCGLPIEACVGKGTGISSEKSIKKLITLQEALKHHQLPETVNAMEVLSTFGGYEIAMMAGAFLKAAELQMTILVDGFIATSAFLVAHALQPAILDYAVFCHVSEEPGHTKALNYLKVRPILQLGMRLGEGTGAVVAYPILQSALSFLNEMASFEQAGVSQKQEALVDEA